MMKVITTLLALAAIGAALTGCAPEEAAPTLENAPTGTGASPDGVGTQQEASPVTEVTE